MGPDWDSRMNGQDSYSDLAMYFSYPHRVPICNIACVNLVKRRGGAFFLDF